MATSSSSAKSAGASPLVQSAGHAIQMSQQIFQIISFLKQQKGGELALAGAFLTSKVSRETYDDMVSTERISDKENNINDALVLTVTVKKYSPEETERIYTLLNALQTAATRIAYEQGPQAGGFGAPQMGMGGFGQMGGFGGPQMGGFGGPQMGMGGFGGFGGQQMGGFGPQMGGFGGFGGQQMGGFGGFGPQMGMGGFGGYGPQAGYYQQPSQGAQEKA